MSFMETHSLQNAWMLCHGRISNIKTELKGHETADQQGAQALQTQPRPRLLVAGNSPMPGCQAAQECRWSSTFSIVPVQGHITGPPPIPDLALKALCPGQLLSLEQTRMVGHHISAIQNKDQQGMLKLLRIFSIHWLTNYYDQVFSLWAIKG